MMLFRLLVDVEKSLIVFHTEAHASIAVAWRAMIAIGISVLVDGELGSEAGCGVIVSMSRAVVVVHSGEIGRRES